MSADRTDKRVLPRMVDVFGLDERARMSRRRRIAHDAATAARVKPMPTSCIGEALAIWGEPIAMDARPDPDIRPVTFDGALPSRHITKEPR